MTLLRLLDLSVQLFLRLSDLLGQSALSAHPQVLLGLSVR
jgi:hypothetical protein